MSKICKNCGKEVDDKYDFCVYCGEKLPNHFICTKCKEEYFEIDYAYCGKCGSRLVPFNERLHNMDLDNLSETEVCGIFWSEFFKEADKRDNKFFGGNRNRPWGYNRFSIKGITGTVLETRGWYQRDHIEIKILIHNNKDLYYHLKEREGYYNEQFPHDLIWRDKKNATNIALEIDDLSIKYPSDWDEIIYQFITQMNKFCEVFSDDIKKFLN